MSNSALGRFLSMENCDSGQIQNSGGKNWKRGSIGAMQEYRDRLKCLYVVAGNLFLLLLTCSAWLCLGPAYQDLHTF